MPCHDRSVDQPVRTLVAFTVAFVGMSALLAGVTLLGLVLRDRPTDLFWDTYLPTAWLPLVVAATVASPAARSSLCSCRLAGLFRRGV
jgi:hypothetical protein